MTMQEMCVYIESNRKKKCNEHLRMVRESYGDIRGFTAKESSQVIIKRKSVFRKGKTYAFMGLWNHHNVPIGI
jgi:hypothetical protein